MEGLEETKTVVPIPSPHAHKYSRGKAVVVAGCERYPGAACLCAQATQFAGAGYTQVFTDPRNIMLLQLRRPSLVVESFSSFDAVFAVRPPYPGAIVVGSGFDDSPSLGTMVRQSIEEAPCAVLIDGGGLAFAASEGAASLAARGEAGRATVLTPHWGEAARLAGAVGLDATCLDATIEDAPARVRFAQGLAKAYAATVVLKGPSTIVAASGAQRHAALISDGGAVLAKAGTGDVLAGVIGGLLAQGMEPFEAAVSGVRIHARAGQCAQQRWGIVSACAEEVLAALPDAIIQIIEDGSARPAVQHA